MEIIPPEEAAKVIPPVPSGTLPDGRTHGKGNLYDTEGRPDLVGVISDHGRKGFADPIAINDAVNPELDGAERQAFIDKVAANPVVIPLYSTDGEQIDTFTVRVEQGLLVGGALTQIAEPTKLD